HWEGDLVSGTKNSHIATLVDRKSRYTIILRLRGKDSVSVNQALTDKFLSLPSELRKSLTWDRGMELARHLEFTVSTGVKVYFCDPQSPWQRGTNENTNAGNRISEEKKKSCCKISTKNGGLLRYGNYCSVGKIQNRVSLKLQKTGQKNFFQLIFINRP
ncbi:TPA: IS30 family transposase, partial [Escherichia coli]